jgi:hypothetical protein
MTTPSEHVDQPAPADPAGTNLLPPEAKAAVAEIKAENAALAEADRDAEQQAEVVAEQAKRLAEVTEEMVEELKEAQG